MKKRTQLGRALALLLLLSVAGSARADLISWGYDWSASPTNVTAGSGSVKLSNETFHVAVGNSQVVATNLQEFSTADPLQGQFDVFGPNDGKYTLTLNLKDLASGQTGALVFKGQLQGQFSSLNSAVSNTYFAPTSQTIVLGATQFMVTMNAYSPPGPPSQGNLGSMGAFVEVAKVRETPEPATLTLAGFGAAAFGLAAWRRRRRAARVSC
jgi:MYXO-CTERM domain-containing protein